MGSIYKRVRKRPIPPDAEIITLRDKTLVQWGGKSGRKYRSALADDGQQMLVKSAAWHLSYTDENGLKKTESSKTSEREVAKQILAARERRVSEIRSGLIDPIAERIQKANKKPIKAHIDDYKTYLKNANRSDYHIEVTVRHLHEAMNFLNLSKINEMTPERAMSFVGWLRAEPLDGKRSLNGHTHRSPRTVNSYIVSLKSFYRWLAMTGRLAHHPIANLKKFPEETDRRHERRAITSEEFTKLFETTYNSPKKIQGVDGPTRATLYLVAALTGLRRKELASLTRENFRLDEPTPTVRIKGAYSNNKKTDEIPLHPTVVERLRDYFERTKPKLGKPVFPLLAPGGGLRATSQMMKRDCESAGIDYKTTDGFVDFHANRVLFITSLCRSNIGLVMAQKLARHSDPKLTSNIYSKVSTEERAEAIGAIHLIG
jgi:integrase